MFSKYSERLRSPVEEFFGETTTLMVLPSYVKWLDFRVV